MSHPRDWDGSWFFSVFFSKTETERYSGQGVEADISLNNLVVSPTTKIGKIQSCTRNGFQVDEERFGGIVLYAKHVTCGQTKLVTTVGFIEVQTDVATEFPAVVERETIGQSAAFFDAVKSAHVEIHVVFIIKIDVTDVSKSCAPTAVAVFSFLFFVNKVKNVVAGKVDARNADTKFARRRLGSGDANAASNDSKDKDTLFHKKDLEINTLVKQRNATNSNCKDVFYVQKKLVK